MKPTKSILYGILTFSICWLLTACGGNKGGSETTAGQQPQVDKMSASYVTLLEFIAEENEKLDKLEEKAKKSTDLNQALKMNQEYEEQVNKVDQDIADKLAKMGNRVNIPFTQEILTDEYKLKQLWIAEANHKNLIIKADIEQIGPMGPKYLAFLAENGELKACTLFGSSVGFPPSRLLGSSKAQVTDKATYDSYRKR